MVFLFGKHELIPIIEELESFLNLKHRHNADATFPVHKNSYFKDFHSTLNVLKDFLPKESSGDYLQCPFDLLLDRGWQKIRDFSNPNQVQGFHIDNIGSTSLISYPTSDRWGFVQCPRTVSYLKEKHWHP